LVANDFTSALAQLLVNPALRDTFSSSPQAAADLLNLNGADRSLFVALQADQIERQAQLLITKRMRETFVLLPLTVKALGATAAAHFSEYATGYWPEGHRRHSLDALNFGEFLRSRQLPLNKSEYNRVRFGNKHRGVRVCFVKDALINGERRHAMQILYRFNSYQGEWRIYFKA